MPTLNRHIAYVGTDTGLFKKYVEQNFVYQIHSIEDLQQLGYATILVIDPVTAKDLFPVQNLKGKFKKTILIFDEKINYKIPQEDLNFLQPQQILSTQQIKESTIIEWIEDIEQNKQNESLIRLSSELNSEYEIIKTDLESKISNQKSELIDRRQKILESNNRTETLRKILFALTAESDISRLETKLNELIPSATKATWVKIIPQAQQKQFEYDLQDQLDNHRLCYPIHNRLVYFIKGDTKPFKKTDADLFSKVADALQFNLLRNDTLKSLQKLEKIVSTAFDSIQNPILIIDKDYRIKDANKAFRKNNSSENSDYCYQVFAGLNSPCPGCQLGKNSTIQNQHHYFNVQSRELFDAEKNQVQWVNFYSDVTEEKLYEQHLAQTAKLKDLGLISSSIAHELNNPLGGIISYIQLLQMEVKKDDPLQKDFNDMLTAALRMKDIIENLLIFSRKPISSQQTQESVEHVIKEAVKLNELQLKVENIHVVFNPTNQDTILDLSKNIFRDSIHLIINFFIDAHRKSKKNKQGLLEIKIFLDQMNCYLEFQSPTGPLQNEQKLKDIFFLTISKSLEDQGFQVELTETNHNWVQIKMNRPLVVKS